MFHFNLGQVTECVPAHDESAADPSGLPPDLYDVIGTVGDDFRDWFTRVCLYLVLRTETSCPGETVVIGTEYGNTAALARLQREAAVQGRRLSAQYFPNATSGSASAFVNIRLGATGRNMTVNAGANTPVLALWQALVALGPIGAPASRLLVGDVYSAEARQDAGRAGPHRCRSGVSHAIFEPGDDYVAEFDFRPAVEPSGEPVAERNGAFAVLELLHGAGALAPGEETHLECRGAGRQRARVVVRRC